MDVQHPLGGNTEHPGSDRLDTLDRGVEKSVRELLNLEIVAPHMPVPKPEAGVQAGEIHLEIQLRALSRRPRLEPRSVEKHVPVDAICDAHDLLDRRLGSEPDLIVGVGIDMKLLTGSPDRQTSQQAANQKEDKDPCWGPAWEQGPYSAGSVERAQVECQWTGAYRSRSCGAPLLIQFMMLVRSMSSRGDAPWGIRLKVLVPPDSLNHR